MANLKGCFSSNSDNWATPHDVYKAFMDKGFKDIFPFRADYDELEKNYYDTKLFINPPYSKLKNKCYIDWITKQILINNNQVALLVPSRTDTKWFRSLLPLADSILFITGRLSFNDLGSAPFPSIIMLFDFPYICPLITILKDNLPKFIINSL